MVELLGLPALILAAALSLCGSDECWSIGSDAPPDARRVLDELRPDPAPDLEDDLRELIDHWSPPADDPTPTIT